MEAQIGDIILSNGKICKLADFDKDTMTAVAVIIREADLENSALGIGIYQAKGKPWCKDTSVEGYKYTNVDKLSALNYNSSFDTGYLDSTTCYEKLTSACSDWINTSNYPAWEYCFTYGVTNKLPAQYVLGWCLPTAHELLPIAANNVYLTIDKSLKKVSGNDAALMPSYVTCNQNGASNMFIFDLSNLKEVDKVTGKAQASSQTVNLYARPVYHFVNNNASLAKPIISDKKDGKVTIDTSSKNAIICYKLDNEEWKELPAPAEITVNGESHTITAYTKKAGLQNSKETEKTIPADAGGVY